MEVTGFVLLFFGLPFTFGIHWFPVEFRWFLWFIWMIFVCIAVSCMCDGISNEIKMGYRRLKKWYKGSYNG